MPKFEYQVRDARGGTATGTLSAADVTEASRLLRGEGHVIIDLHERRGSASGEEAPAIVPAKVRAKRDDVIFFANQLAVMVDTGVPLSDAIDSIAENAEHDRFKQVIEGVSDQVKSGVEFSAALGRYPRVFDRLFVAMVKASEVSGTLGTMLQRAAAHMEAQRAVRRRVKGAMAYPLAMLGFCVLVVIGMLLFILPRFAKIYEGKSAALPLPTRALLALSGAVTHHYLIILAVLTAAGAAAYVLLTRPEIGPMYRKACLARSLRTLATMVATGVSMLESIRLAAEVTGSIEFGGVWRALEEKLKEGASLSEEMRRFPLMPPPVCQMVAAGERTGKLAPVLDRVAGFCEEDLDTAIKTATSFIEPLMIVVMGVIVGGIAMALLLPVFSLSKVVAS